MLFFKNESWLEAEKAVCSFSLDLLQLDEPEQSLLIPVPASSHKRRFIKNIIIEIRVLYKSNLKWNPVEIKGNTRWFEYNNVL